MSKNSPVPSESHPVPAAAERHLPGAGAGLPGGPVGPGGPTMSLVERSFLAILRYKWMIVVILILGTGAGVVALRYQEATYETRSQIWIGSGLSGGTAGRIREGSLLAPTGWQNLLRSSAVLDSVVLQRRLFLSLQERSDTLVFEGFRFDRQRLRPGRYQISLGSDGQVELAEGSGAVLERRAPGEAVGSGVGFVWVPEVDRLPRNRPVAFTLHSPGDVAARLARELQTSQTVVQGQMDDNFLVIALRGQDPVQVTATLEAVVDRFEQVSLELKKVRLTAQTELLEDQLRRAERQLAEHESALQNFRVTTATLPTEQRGIGAPLPAGLQLTDNTVFGNFFALNTQKDQLVRDRAAIRKALTDDGGNAGLIAALEVIPSVQTSTELTMALAEAATTESKLRALRLTFTDEHPLVRQPMALRDSLYSRVIPRLASTLLAEIGRRESELDGQISSSSEEMRRIPIRVIEGQKLERQRAIADEMYRELESRFQQSRLAEATTTPDLTVVDRPNMPFTPVQDPRRTLLVLFAGGALALGIGLALLRDRLDSRVQYPDQVTAGMGLSILGAVPGLRGRRLDPSDMALAVEAFRSIQLSLTHVVGNGGPMTVTLSSPGASDGKSFVTSNLAIAFAEMGHRTLVIDGDVRRGTMHKLLGGRKRPGLTDYLLGRVERDVILQGTSYPSLHFIGCGSRNEKGPKLLGSPRMRELVRDLQASYDVLLVDSPPLGACVDPMVLATLTRNIVLVVRTGATDRALAESRLDALDQLPVRVVGAVLNDVDQGGPYRYYSYVTGYEILEDDGHALPPGSEGDGVAAAPDGEAYGDPAERPTGV